MYQTLHNDFFTTLQARKDFRLAERRLNLGAAVKQIKAAKRIRMKDLVQSTGISRPSLDTLIHTGEVNTSGDRFLKLAQHLNVTSDRLIRVARETAHYNFYHLEKENIPLFSYRTYEAEIYSPPSFSRKDFMWCKIRLRPGKSINNLLHRAMDQVAGFVTNGHLGLKYGGKIHTIHTNQSFFFDPKIEHSYENQVSSGTTEFYLLYQLKPEPKEKDETRGRKAASTTISTAHLIRQIRKELSPDPNRLLPLPALSALSGIEMGSLIHLCYQKTKIIPFEKIDRLVNLTDYSFDSMIQKAENRYEGWIQVFTDQDKTMTDLTARHGVEFTNHSGLGTGKRKFTIADIVFDSWREGSPRKEWKYQGTGFMGISVQRGKIGIQYGSQPLKALGWGDYLYLNADAEITLTNLLSEAQARQSGDSPEAKATIFSFPPII